MISLTRPTADIYTVIVAGSFAGVRIGRIALSIPTFWTIEQPTKLELVINLKAAKQLGLTIPQSLIVRADQVVQ